MIRTCLSQTRAFSGLGLGAPYDGGSKDLRVELVSESFRKSFCPFLLTNTIFSHRTHDVKKVFPIVTSLHLI